MSPLRFLTVLLLTAAAAGVAAAPARPGRNLVAVEFVDSPPTGLVVSSGLLGVPDSAGRFPEPYQRYDSVTGQGAETGTGFGNVLVFRDLGPGVYRVAFVFLEESKLATRLLPKNRQDTEDRFLVYRDSIPEMTFAVADGEVRYLGKVTRKSRPTLEDSTEVWRTSLEWHHGDEGKVLKGLAKRKELASWRALIEARAAKLEAAGEASPARR